MIISISLNDASMVRLAQKYIWWESEQWAFQHPVIFLASIMNFATGEELLYLSKHFKPEILRSVLDN